MGIEIVREYVEQGVTGDASWSDRPAFQEMVSAILDNGVRTVIVENLTRLARAYVVQDAILVFLASKEVSLISAYTGEGVTAAFHGDPMKKAIIQMQAVFSALEKNSLVRKLKAARARKRAENGRCEGRKPFGERSGEKGAIVRMRQLRRKPVRKDKRMSFAKNGQAMVGGKCSGHSRSSCRPTDVRHKLAASSPLHHHRRARLHSIVKPLCLPLRKSHTTARRRVAWDISRMQSISSTETHEIRHRHPHEFAS